MSGVAGSVMPRNSGCFLMNAATVGQTGDNAFPVGAGRLKRFADQMLAKPRPPNRSSTSVW